MTRRAYLGVTTLALSLAMAAGHRGVTVARAAMPMAEQVGAAKTAADHEALAADYERMATDAKSQASAIHATAVTERSTFRPQLGQNLAPGGIGAPVLIRAASPDSIRAALAAPAAISPVTDNSTGTLDTSCARTAYPSTIDLSNAG